MNSRSDPNNSSAEHFAADNELLALYRTVYGDRAKDRMKPEAVEAREARAKRRRVHGCAKYWADTYGS